MENTQKLAQLIAEHPNAKLMPMVSSEINLSGDFDSRCANIEDCEYAEITIREEDGVLYTKSEIKELIDTMVEWDDMTEQEAEKYVKEDVSWAEVILVWIVN